MKEKPVERPLPLSAGDEVWKAMLLFEVLQASESLNTQSGFRTPHAMTTRNCGLLPSCISSQARRICIPVHNRYMGPDCWSC